MWWLLLLLLLDNFIFCWPVFLQCYFEDNIDDDKYCGHLYGLGSAYMQNGSAYTEENNAAPTTTAT